MISQVTTGRAAQLDVNPCTSFIDVFMAEEGWI
jgi:hypothetical protein